MIKKNIADLFDGNISYSFLTIKCARVLVPQPKKTQFENITLLIG